MNIENAENINQAARNRVKNGNDNVAQSSGRTVFGNLTNGVNQSVAPRQEPKPVPVQNVPSIDDVASVPRDTINHDDENMDFEDGDVADILNNIVSDVFDETPSVTSSSSHLNPLPSLEIAFRVPEYNSDALAYWKEAEEKFMPIPRYMRRQREIDWEMRATLVDWLVEVGEEFRLSNETLHLSILYVDRFLSIMNCTRDKLQLAGVAAMFIASKYEEIYPPSPLDFVNLTDNTYTTRQLLKLEIQMLKALGYSISCPTANGFINHYIQTYDDLYRSTPAANISKLENLTKYLCELTLLEGEEMLVFRQSHVAAASLYVAAATLDMNDWLVQIPKRTGYSLSELEKPARLVDSFFNAASNGESQWRAVTEKYREARYDGIADLPPSDSLPLQME